MKPAFARYLLGAVLILLLLGHAARLYQLSFLNHLDAILYDVKTRLTLPGGVDDRVVILDIDERSLAEVGRWPWSRDKLARLTDTLFDRYGIALLGIDIVFAEPDESSGLKTMERLASGELRGHAAFQQSLERLRPELDFDGQFVAALKDRPVILGYYLSDRAGGASTGALPPPLLPAGSFRGRNIPFASFPSYGGNLPTLQAAAAGAGHFNPLIDFDGIVRRVPMIAEYKGAYYESLSLAMLRLLLGNPKVLPSDTRSEGKFGARDYGGLEWLDLPSARGTVRIPVDENVAALIPYRGYQGSFRYISLADVLSERTPVDQLKGRIALLGTTAPGLLDLRATPVGATYPGVEIHANLITGMLDGTLRSKPQYVIGLDVSLIMLVGGIMLFLLPRLSPVMATITTLAVIACLVAINLGFWIGAKFVLPMAATFLLTIGLFLFNMSWGYFIESRSKRQFAELFGQYVPPELVQEMSRNPEHYSMEGKSAELTVLFSDIRGFTSISEGMEPKQLASLMNEYLGSMTDVIQEQRGTLDKYIGDAIMAFWGAPVADAEHARHAVLAALGMHLRLRELNQSLRARGLPELRIGVGINTGTMTVGDMGSPVRKAYTVLGDAVNLSSRLEGMTKEYGVGVLVGEATRKAVRDIVFREVDRVRAKGKAEPVAIFEPLGVDGELTRAVHDELKLWNQALRAYRAQDWDQAELQLFNLSRITPASSLYELYRERVQHYRSHPPGPDWDGVTTFTTK